MKKVVTVKGVTIGEGTPKICVPMVGETIEQLVEEAEYLKTIHFDVLEWRADFFQQVEQMDKVQEALTKIRSILPEIPLIFTFRSKKEGGEKEIPSYNYVELNKKMMETGLIDLVDVELYNDEKDIHSLVMTAETHGVYVIISNHDFNGTPSKEEIIARLKRALELGADLPKIAVMPACAEDVLTLLDATLTMTTQFANRPIITMSMGGKGMLSRVSGEVFGSALTFGAAKKASAPGQVNVEDLRQVLDLFHKSLSF